MKKLGITLAIVMAFALLLTTGSFARMSEGAGSSSDTMTSPGSSSDTMTSPRGSQGIAPGMSQDQAGQMTTAQKASDLIGKTVQGKAGDQIGEINDLVVDPASGRVSYAVISATAAGLGDKLYPVPFTALRSTPGQTAMTLDIDKQKLQSAPSFDRNNWPDLTSQSWQSNVNSFYSEQTLPGGRTAPSPGMTPGSSSPGSR